MITLHPVQYVDLALKSEQDPGIKLKVDGTVDADWFVIATAAKVANLIYLLDVFRAQIPFPEQIKAVVREHKRWKSWKVGIENNAYQWALGQAVWEKGVPAIPIPSTKDKVTRYQMVTPHFETGRVRLRGVKENGVVVAHPSMRRFEVEAIDVPFGDYDDTADAVTGVVQMLTSDEIMGQEPVYGQTRSGFAIVGGRGARGRDPFDEFRSIY